MSDRDIQCGRREFSSGSLDEFEKLRELRRILREGSHEELVDNMLLELFVDHREQVLALFGFDGGEGTVLLRYWDSFAQAYPSFVEQARSLQLIEGRDAPFPSLQDFLLKFLHEAHDRETFEDLEIMARILFGGVPVEMQLEPVIADFGAKLIRQLESQYANGAGTSVEALNMRSQQGFEDGYDDERFTITDWKVVIQAR